MRLPPEAVCPLCTLSFRGTVCHVSCPLAPDCAMVRCPRCGYEFVAESSLLKLLTALCNVFSGRRGHDLRNP